MNSVQKNLLGWLAVVVFAAGCGRDTEPTRKEIRVAPPPKQLTEATDAPLTPPPSADAPPTSPAPVKPGEEFTRIPAFMDLNTALNQFVARNKRFPEKVDELNVYCPHGVPPPPAGKQYFIDREAKTIRLVDR